MDKEQITALIDDIIDDKNSEALTNFSSIISSKVSDYLDLKKLELSSTIYGSKDE